MVLINDNWEQIRCLQDISDIIRKYYNEELADELDNLIPEHSDEDYYDLECVLDDKECDIAALEDEIADMDDEISDLKDEIYDLQNIIVDLEVMISELKNN